VPDSVLGDHEGTFMNSFDVLTGSRYWIPRFTCERTYTATKTYGPPPPLLLNVIDWVGLKTELFNESTYEGRGFFVLKVSNRDSIS